MCCGLAVPPLCWCICEIERELGWCGITLIQLLLPALVKLWSLCAWLIIIFAVVSVKKFSDFVLYELFPFFNSSQPELDLFCHEVPHIMPHGTHPLLLGGTDDPGWPACIPFNPWVSQSRFTWSFSHEIWCKYWTILYNMKIVGPYLVVHWIRM